MGSFPEVGERFATDFAEDFIGLLELKRVLSISQLAPACFRDHRVLFALLSVRDSRWQYIVV